MSEGKSHRRRRMLMWVAFAVVSAPLLFVLFEIVIPKLLPENF